MEKYTYVVHDIDLRHHRVQKDLCKYVFLKVRKDIDVVNYYWKNQCHIFRKQMFTFHIQYIYIMAILVVEFLREGYKIRKVLAKNQHKQRKLLKTFQFCIPLLKTPQPDALWNVTTLFHDGMLIHYMPLQITLIFAFYVTNRSICR